VTPGLDHQDRRPIAQAAVPGAEHLSLPRDRSMSAVVWAEFRRHPMALAGLTILAAIVLMSVFAFASPYDPEGVDVANRFAPPSVQHPFGTDRSGRDVLTRILYGGRVSLAVGASAVMTAVVIGSAVGALAGYWGGIVDSLLMRLTDAFLSFPSLFVLILLSSLLRESVRSLPGGAVATIALVIGLTSWMTVARLVRAVVMAIREEEFVTAARSSGSTDGRILLAHIAPNAASPVIVNATMGIAWAILTESGLSFLGFGIQPPTPSWGNILTDGQATLSLYPWLAVFPGMMIFLTVMAINWIGDGLRDALDPFTVSGRRG
jgi:peptide/nickel transport system permease protein